MGGQRHATTALPPGSRPGTHCIGVWVGPRAGVKVCGISAPPPNGSRSSDRPASNESLYRLNYSGRLETILYPVELFLVLLFLHLVEENLIFIGISFVDFHPFHLWRYSFFRALASLIRRLHSSLFTSLLRHPLIPSSCSAPL
jgi:hypothetical protein